VIYRNKCIQWCIMLRHGPTPCSTNISKGSLHKVHWVSRTHSTQGRTPASMLGSNMVYGIGCTLDHAGNECSVARTPHGTKHQMAYLWHRLCSCPKRTTVVLYDSIWFNMLLFHIWYSNLSKWKDKVIPLYKLTHKSE